MKSPIITLVVAMNHDRVIGVANKLPWHIPEDLQYFKQVTLGKPIIMGRKTFESIGRVLPGRKNIVISRNTNLKIDGVSIYSSLTDAIIHNSEYPELCVIGGGEIFKQALPIANKLHITIVNLPISNPSTFFPEVDLAKWSLIKERRIISSGTECTFKEFIKI